MQILRYLYPFLALNIDGEYIMVVCKCLFSVCHFQQLVMESDLVTLDAKSSTFPPPLLFK